MLSKRLDAAHHRWLRRILGISWKDKVTNEEVRARTGQQPSAVEDCAGSVIQYVWIIAALHMKHYTGRSQVSRGDPVGQEQTGEV